MAIARALINKPKLIFADEPTGNLDTKSGTDVMELLKELHVLGHTIILITHDQKIANQARRMLLIEDGTLQRDTLL